MIDNTLEEEVIEVLKESRQTLVFLNAIITPVREVVPDSDRDKIMSDLIEKLKSRRVIEYATGYWSLYRQPGFFYAISFGLTDHFFKANCTPRVPEFEPYQLSLFY